MTKEEVKKQLLYVEKMWKTHLEAHDETECIQAYESCIKQWKKIRTEQCYPHIEHALIVRKQLKSLLDSPDYLDYYHDEPLPFDALANYAKQEGYERDFEDLSFTIKEKVELTSFCITKLWEKKTEDGNKFFRHNYQWQAIYQVIVEYNVLPINSAAQFRDICLDPTHFLHFLPDEHSSFKRDDPRMFTYYKYDTQDKTKKKVGGTYCELSENRPENSDAAKLIKETKEVLIQDLSWFGLIND